MGSNVLMLVLGILAIIGSIFLSVVGFMGHMSPFFAGFGWVLATLFNVSSVLRYAEKVNNDGKENV